MKSVRMGWKLAAISGSVALTLLTAACGTLDDPWAGPSAGGGLSNTTPGTAPSTQASCDGGIAYSARDACGSPWLLPR
jgi:hypothetical protein